MKPTFELIKRSAKSLGIAIAKYPPPGSLERYLRDFLTTYKINVVLDVGAFSGSYPKFMREELGYTGRIISFEPVPASFKKLSARCSQDSLWTGQPYGLSNEDREALINTHDHGDFNSLLRLREDAEKAYDLDPSSRRQIPIQLKRLDSVLPDLLKGIDSPRIFLKMDTQGHDLSVMEGAAGVLDSIIGLQSELPAVEIYDGMASMSDALTRYSNWGFVPTGFYAVNTMPDTLISPEFDVIFSRFNGKIGHI